MYNIKIYFLYVFSRKLTFFIDLYFYNVYPYKSNSIVND